jgi:Arc/MetJ family transcription regulator
MAVHEIDIDDALLAEVQSDAQTTGVAETVGYALRIAATHHQHCMSSALDALAHTPVEDKLEAWQ